MAAPSSTGPRAAPGFNNAALATLVASAAYTVVRVRTTLCTTALVHVAAFPIVLGVARGKSVYDNYAHPAPVDTSHAHADVEMADIVPASPKLDIARAPVNFLPLNLASEDDQHQDSCSASGGVARTDVRAARKKRRFAPYSSESRAERKKRVSVHSRVLDTQNSVPPPI